MSGKKPSSQQSRVWGEIRPGLSEWILTAVASMGFDKLTPVQASTIPLFLGNKDVVVEAVTGSGKTLAFVIPVLERLKRLDEPIKKHHVGSIIISPTRELAAQIFGVVEGLLAFDGPAPAVDGEESTQAQDAGQKIVPQLLIGGIRTVAQDLSMFLTRSPNILISTPGRLLELLSSPYVHCSQAHFDSLVLDEADKLLDMGFKDDVQKIFHRLPKQRRTGLFSASVTEAVGEIVRAGLRNPVKIVVKVRGFENSEEKRTPASLQMSYILSPANKKLSYLRALVAHVTPTPQKSIIYFSSCAAVDYFSAILPLLFSYQGGLAFTFIPLHGKHVSQVRQKNFARFIESVSPTILLTTDLAARGLDIPEVDLVIQLDPPTDPNAFLHRSGRAGRAGRRGLSVLFLQPGAEEDYIPFLEVRQTPVSLYPATLPISESENTALLQEVRTLVLQDRALFDRGQRAFVSWVQSYRKHQAKSIFRLSNLAWVELGRGWGLIKLPKMPELKEWDGDRSLGFESIDMATYAYKDKAREKQRLENLANFQIQGLGKSPHHQHHHSGKQKETIPWSQKVDAHSVKEVRREKKHRKRDAVAWEKMTPEERKDVKELKELMEKVKTQRIEKQQLLDVEERKEKDVVMV